MSIRLVVCFVLLLSINLPCLQKSIYAQDVATNGKKENDKLIIDSVPRDAYVEISGKYSFVGRTPLTLPYKLYGKYKITAKKSGYETYSADVNLSRRGASLITLRLNKKTRFSASYRSLLLPGWGQLYGQNKFKGFFVGLTQVSLGIGTYIINNRYDDKKEKYEAALVEFNQPGLSFEQAEIAFQKVDKAYNSAKDLQDLRNIFVSATVGFWVFNILDSIIFFSSHKKRFGNSTWYKPNLSGQITNDQAWMSMKFRF